MSANKLFNHFVRLVLLGMTVLYAGSAYSVEKENLDVSLSPLYLSTRPHRNSNIQSEISFQIPFGLTDKAEKTGLGLIGAIAYLDSKNLVRINSEGASIRGVGRLYYVYSAYGTTNTFIPYATLYRELLIQYSQLTGSSTSPESKSSAWLTPGFMYAHRINDKVVFHLDAALYSYNRARNNTSRIGASYALPNQWIASASYERLGWDMKDGGNNQIFMKGTSNNVYLKFINSNPPKNNFAVILGYAANSNTPGPGLSLQRSVDHSHSLFFGVEVSLGVLAW